MLGTADRLFPLPRSESEEGEGGRLIWQKAGKENERVLSR